MQSQDPNGDLVWAVWESGYPAETGKGVLCWYVWISPSPKFQHWNSCSELLFLRSDQWVGIFGTFSLSYYDVGSSDKLCSWLCQPRPRTVATDFHLHILSWRTLGFVSPTGCVPGLKDSTISRVALICCFAVWSVVGLEIRNLSPAPPALGTISCPGKQGSPHLLKLSVQVFVLLPGCCDRGALPVKFSGSDCSTDLESPFPAHA